MTDPDRKLRGIKQTPRKTQRASNQEYWVNAPLQNAIRDALAAREWSISDLGRAIGSQPSLVSRWMMGSRPSTSSIIAISRALGLDVKRLLVLAGHLPPDSALSLGRMPVPWQYGHAASVIPTLLFLVQDAAE